MSIPLIDVFAGPGGLNEGFSSLLDAQGEPIFKTVASFEMDPWACKTLRLRAAVRHYRRNDRVAPRAYYEFLRGAIRPDELEADPDMAVGFKEAEAEVVCMALGPETRNASNERIENALRRHVGSDDWVLIGGPPCQAYSLAGRSRRKGDPTFADDHKHVLYREYLAILERFKPSVFVMENVKGMLSSRHAGGAIFQSIRDDLSAAGYELRSFVVAKSDPSPSDFVIRSENYGIPQKRHRVILLGIRHGTDLDAPGILAQASLPVTVDQVIGRLPPIRSMISPRRSDEETDWRRLRGEAWLLAGERGGRTAAATPELGRPFVDRPTGDVPGTLGDWLLDDRIGGVTLHESRAHMAKDLMRYGYLAHKAAKGERPKVGDLPEELIPNHRNARNADAPFADRFRVQLAGQPSTTVVSHISKDGHYYIHPDPVQMRSLSVREAARLQTFPDDYFFVGSRTQQYHQVGNAVPPLLARQLGAVVARMFGRTVSDQRL